MKSFGILITLIFLVSCSNESKPAESDPDKSNETAIDSNEFQWNSKLDSMSTEQFGEYVDSTMESSNVSLDSSLLSLENQIEELKAELKQNPENTFIKNQISNLEESLKLSKMVIQDINSRDKEIKEVINNKLE